MNKTTLYLSNQFSCFSSLKVKTFIAFCLLAFLTLSTFAQTVTCGATTNTTHCYDNFDATTWLYTASDGTSPLKITFNAGGIESCCDNINVYDGTNNTAALLYGGNNAGNLAGLEITATGPNIFMEINADSSVSCVSGSGCCITQWDWDVECLSCSPAAGSAALGTCSSGVGNMIDVTVTDIGDGTVNITNDGGVGPTSIMATGTYPVGPFAFSSTVTITLEHDTDPTCNVVLPAISIPSDCPPANDECSGAFPLTVNADLACGSTTAGTIENATASSDDPSACSGTEDDDVWFSFVATATTHAIELVNILNGTTDLYHSVWEGTCGGLTLLAGSCSDPNNSTVSGLTIGNIYFLRVYSWTSTAGQTTTFDVCIGTNPPAPANDDCAGALPVTVNSDLACGSFTSGSIAFSTPSPEDPTACSGTEDDDVWFSFVATATDHEISLINITGGTTDLYHSVWEGTCGGLTLFAGSCSDPNSSTVTGLTMGNTYYLRVYSWTSTSGQTTAFDVCIGTSPAPPPEDTCMGAIVIPVTANMCTGISTANNAGATNSNFDVPAPPAATCSAYNGGDIWFTLTVPASGNVVISGANSDGCCSFLWYEVYTGTDCSTLTSLACSDTNSGTDNNDPSTYEKSLTGLTPGSSIWIRAWDSSNDNGPGDFNLCAYELSCTAPIVTIPAGAIDNTNCPATVDFSISIDNLGNSGTLTISAEDALGNPAGTGGTVSVTGIFTITNVPVPQTAWSIIIAHETDPTCDVTIGPFALNCPPLNDDMCNAEAITLDAPQIPGNNAYSTFEPNESPGSCWINTSVGNSVWYSFVAPASGRVEITTDFATPLNDTQIALYTTTDCADLLIATEIACDEDGGTTGNGWNSYLETTAAPLIGGATYYIQVDGYAGGVGDFEIQVNEIPVCTGVTTTWDGAAWDNGIPDLTTPAVINGVLQTAGTSIEACSCEVNSLFIIDQGDYLLVNSDITISGGGLLAVDNDGSVVQVDDAAVVTNAGAINIVKTTPLMAPQSFMISGSPMTMETREGVFGNGYIVRNHVTANFVPNPDVEAVSPGVNNWADDNGDNWLTHTGLLNPGEGYLVFPQPDGTSTGSFTYTQIHTQGTLNNGVINFTLDFNADQNSSPSNLANPYASAIDLEVFFDDPANANIDVVYFWEHITPLSDTYPGYNSDNFSMADISFYQEGVGGLGSASGSLAPTQFISSGQGFGVKPTAGGVVEFNNAMRVTTPNNTYRSSEPILRDRLWINVYNDTYGLGSTTLIAFTENTSDVYINWEDVKRLATPVSLYSDLDTEEELAINALGTFETNDAVHLGFSTQVKETQSYRISIHDLDGVNMLDATVFLIDALTSTVTNLSEGDYTFESSEAVYSKRFKVVFENGALGINDSNLETISLYPNPTQNIITIVSPQVIVTSATIYDLRGRKVSEVIFSNQTSYQIDMTNLEAALYFVEIATESGTLTKRVLKK